MAERKKKNPVMPKRKLKYFSRKTVFEIITDTFIGCSEGGFCIDDTIGKQEMLEEAKYLQSLKDKR